MKFRVCVENKIAGICLFQYVFPGEWPSTYFKDAAFV